MNFISQLIENLKNNPVKTLLTFLSVGTGVGILVFALSISQLFTQLLEQKTVAEGVVLTVSNSELQADGTYAPARPGQLDQEAHTLVVDTVEGIEASAIVYAAPFRELTLAGKKYQIRRVSGVSESYFDIMGLDIIAGQAMTSDDVAEGERLMWLSESAATMAFGNADQAIGANVETPSFGRGGGGDRAPSIYTVAGVYEDADDLKRNAYGIADAMVPYTSALSNSGNPQRMISMLAGTFVVRADSQDLDAQIRASLTYTYGEDLNVNIWEGTTQGPSTILQETRDSVSTLTLVINLLGFILLISGAIGILSIMMVEILGRSKEIALQRALGASINQVARGFLAQSLSLSAISSLIGIGIAYLVAQPLAGIVASVFSSLSVSELPSGIIQLNAIAIGSISALVFGGLFGVLPLFSLTRQPIAEGLRDA